MTIRKLEQPGYVQQVESAEDCMTIMRREMRAYEPKHLATRVGVSRGCIYAILNGKTKWPRHATFFALVDVLGLTITLVKK